jgi:urea carboxylase
VQYESLKTTQSTMLYSLIRLEQSVVKSHDPLPSRIFNFPLLLNDPLSKAAVADYVATVRDSAVYLPDNMDYIAKANGVSDRDTAAKSLVACRQCVVRFHQTLPRVVVDATTFYRLVTEVSFLAGTPLMLPLDPR